MITLRLTLKNALVLIPAIAFGILTILASAPTPERTIQTTDENIKSPRESAKDTLNYYYSINNHICDVNELLQFENEYAYIPLEGIYNDMSVLTCKSTAGKYELRYNEIDRIELKEVEHSGASFLNQGIHYYVIMHGRTYRADNSAAKRYSSWGPNKVQLYRTKNKDDAIEVYNAWKEFDGK